MPFFNPPIPALGPDHEAKQIALVKQWLRDAPSFYSIRPEPMMDQGRRRACAAAFRRMRSYNRKAA